MLSLDRLRIPWPACLLTAALLAGVAAQPPNPSSLDPRRRLVHEASSTARGLAPRLSGGFSWAPLQPPHRGQATAPIGAWDEVANSLASKGSTASRGSRHALALCDLLRGRPQRAAEQLAALVNEQPLPHVWNDIAAADLVTATTDDDPSRLARALAAADAALQGDPSFAEARFNRALILEALGLRDAARDEWDAFLRLDSSSGWAIEARQHRSALLPVIPFDAQFEKRYRHLCADEGEARALAARYPQETRVAAKEQVLARWGAATLAGDASTASQHLALARAIGAELVQNGGDELVAELVAAIERANDVRRKSLARAHVHFAQGRDLYRGRKLQEAEAALKAATAEFVAGGSPGELLASAFLANTVYEAHRVAECSERLKDVLARTGSRYPALRAGVYWQLGGVAYAYSRWGESLQAFRESFAIFDRLGEKTYAAVLEGLIGNVYGRVGEAAQSWKHRAAALRELGQTPSFRLHVQLDGIVQAAIAERDWRIAESFLGLDIDLAGRMKDAGVVAVEARLSRAELHIHQNNRMRAEADLTEAKRLIAMREPADRLHSGAKAKVVEAMLADDAETAAALLTEAIDFHQNLGRRMHLPRLFMLRGRAHRSLANYALARNDFESGVAELEKHRESLHDGRDRWGVFHTAEDLFDDAILLALDQGDIDGAFAYAERERARGLLDDLGTSWRPVASSDIPADTVVIEYAVQDHGLVIFTADRQGVHAVRQDVPREQLERGITALKHAAAASDVATIRESGKDLYRILIAPVEERLIGASQIAFVPDPRLGNLPFATLCDSGNRFLIESYAIAVEPSAAVFTRLNKREIATRDRRVLIATGSNELGVLTFAGEETRAIAREYGNVVQLSRERLTTAAFARDAAAANVIHFVGHGVVSQKPGEPAYILLGEGRLDTKKVAALELPRTSLVVLAACSTADGELRSAEGTISMARAFVAAGASAVVGTLRPIVDMDAARFFPRFHQHIASGIPPAEALRRTQLEWIDRGDKASIWTAVQIIGR